MVFVGVLFALFYALLLTFVFAVIIGNTGPWRGFWAFFFIIFFIAFAAGEWVTPLGPPLWGYYWLPGLMVALIFALLIVALTPSNSNKNIEEENRTDKKSREDVKREITPTSYYSPHSATPRGERLYKGNESTETIALGGFFWLLITTLFLVAIAGVIF